MRSLKIESIKVFITSCRIRLGLKGVVFLIRKRIIRTTIKRNDKDFVSFERKNSTSKLFEAERRELKRFLESLEWNHTIVVLVHKRSTFCQSSDQNDTSMTFLSIVM